MSKPEILNETPMLMAEVKAELAKIKKRDGELSFRANKTEEYLNHFVEISQKKAKDLYADLQGLKIPRLKEIHMMKLVDVMPATIEETKVTLQGYQTLTVSQDNIKKLVKTINDFKK